jgi:protein SCO1
MKYLLPVLLAIALLSCDKADRKLPYYDSADFTPRWEISADTFHQIRPFALIDQKEGKFTEQDIEGKICVVDFFFTSCPGICPKLAVSMAGLQAEFLQDDQVLLLSHSVMPDRDTPAVLQKYATDKQVDFNKWKLLTGDRDEIYELGRKYYFVEEDEGLKRDNDVFLHTENFVLIDQNRRIRGIYNGLDPNSMQALTADIKVLKLE